VVWGISWDAGTGGETGSRRKEGDDGRTRGEWRMECKRGFLHFSTKETVPSGDRRGSWEVELSKTHEASLPSRPLGWDPDIKILRNPVVGRTVSHDAFLGKKF